MKACNHDCRIVVLLLFVYIQTSLQYYDIPDLPWKNESLLLKNSDIKASLHLNKIDELSDVSIVTLHDSNSQMISPVFSVLEEWQNVSSLCHTTVEKLGNVSSWLIDCFVRNARPITVCQNCVEEYLDFYDVYKNICISTGDKEMQECQNQLLNKDKLNVIKKTCDFASSFWINGYCANCFENENGSLTPSLNNKTKKFLEISESVDKCFRDPSSEVHNSTITKNGSVCLSCRTVYGSLLKDYSDLQENDQTSICMDLTDIMNTTRELWSDYYHCSVMTASGVFVYILATFFSVLVVLFYSGFRFIARAQNTRIIGQKRFVRKQRSSSGQHQLNSFQ